MAKTLFHLGRWSYFHKRFVIAVWLVLLAAVAALSLTFQKGFNDLFVINDVPSTHATQLLEEKFPGTGNPAASADVNVVFQAPEGQKLDQPKYMTAMDETVSRLQKNVPDFKAGPQFGNPVTLNRDLSKMLIDQMTKQGLPKETAKSDAENLRLYSADGRYGMTSFKFDVPLPADVTKEDRQAVYDAIQVSRDAGLTVEVGGPGFGDPIEVEPISEIAGVVVALVILAFTFGSLLAAGLPLITAIVGVGIGALVTVGATALVPLNSTTPTLGLMIGLAVGIDYALFIMSRFRDELREGRGRADAVGLATGTAGSAVIFAGVTVTVGLLGLRLADIPFLSYMGYFAAFSVIVAVLVALTLLPALLGLCGSRLFKRDAAFGAQHARALADARGAHGYFTGGPSGMELARERGEVPEPESRLNGVPGSREKADGSKRKYSLSHKWIRLVYRFPGLMVAVVTLFLAALTLPALNLQLSLPNDSTANVDSTQRKAADLIAEGFGPGRNAPFLVIIDGSHAKPDAGALQTYMRAQQSNAGQQGGPAQANQAQGNAPAADPARSQQNLQKAATQASFIYAMEQLGSNVAVKHAQLVGQSPDGSTAQILITPRGGPLDEETVNLIGGLRAQQATIEAETGVDMGITGLMPIQQDVTDRLSDAMPIYLALVVGLALVLLLMVFRSLMVPFMAAVGFLLSVGAAFGMTVLVWQEGLWGLWDSPGPLISFMPIFLIGVTFGLAMDYQVFIASRMRERFIHESRRAAKRSRYTEVEDSVVYGFGLGAKVVTVAALIMIGVFASFVFQPLPFVQIFGFALGMGVLFDAFLIRMTLMPALMVLFNRATWYMPRWLDRILPRFDVEGAALERAFREGEISRAEERDRPRRAEGGRARQKRRQQGRHSR